VGPIEELPDGKDRKNGQSKNTEDKSREYDGMFRTNLVSTSLTGDYEFEGSTKPQNDCHRRFKDLLAEYRGLLKEIDTLASRTMQQNEIIRAILRENIEKLELVSTFISHLSEGAQPPLQLVGNQPILDDYIVPGDNDKRPLD
jgi:hypothetical protein